jgi:lipoate-protein ligase A
MSMFAALDVYYDAAAHSAAMNMAIDEALLDFATVPCVRFYRWHSPALSFGYFGRFSDVAAYAPARDLVRRWTGGGLVFHGEDLTYSIVIPAGDAVYGESSTVIYEKVHRALCDALNANGQRAVVTGRVDPGRVAVAMRATVVPPLRDERRNSEKGDLPFQIVGRRTGDRRSLVSAVTNRRYNDCFANPVRADVLIDGRKVAGAAQRRTRHGLLQQGSIQGIDVGNTLAERFACALSGEHSERRVGQEILNRARELTLQKYRTHSWLRKR